MPSWRVAKSLLRLRNQIDMRFPRRNKAADGTIGDIAHRSRQSDHNAWVRDGTQGVVTALDITHDPTCGLDTWAMGSQLREARDPRVKYVISNFRIFSSSNRPWTWRKYTGSNPHSHHIHISVLATKRHYDDINDWAWLWSDVKLLPDTPDYDNPETRPHLRRGSTGHLVRTVQELLRIDIDGIYGPRTEIAVTNFQRKHKPAIPISGIVGPYTWRALDTIEQLPDHILAGE